MHTLTYKGHQYRVTSVRQAAAKWVKFSTAGIQGQILLTTRVSPANKSFSAIGEFRVKSKSLHAPKIAQGYAGEIDYVLTSKGEVRRGNQVQPKDLKYGKKSPNKKQFDAIADHAMKAAEAYAKGKGKGLVKLIMEING